MPIRIVHADEIIKKLPQLYDLIVLQWHLSGACMLDGEFERRWKRRPLRLQNGVARLFTRSLHSHASTRFL